MIPKIIHYCWFGGNPKPKLAEKCIKSWKKYCKGYEIREWNEENFDISSAPLYVRQAYEAKKWAFVSDYVRLWIIYHYGGIYFDTDVEVIKPLDKLLQHKAFAGFETPSNLVALGLGFGAVPENKIIKELMESYNDLSFINQDGSLNMVTLPQINSDVFRRFCLIENNTNQMIEEMMIYSSEYFCPFSYDTHELHKTKNTYTIHWYSASWWDEQQKIDLKNRIKSRKKQERYYKRKNILDWIKHIPNWVIQKILGTKNYDKLKKKMKG